MCDCRPSSSSRAGFSAGKRGGGSSCRQAQASSGSTKRQCRTCASGEATRRSGCGGSQRQQRSKRELTSTSSTCRTCYRRRFHGRDVNHSSSGTSGCTGNSSGTCQGVRSRGLRQHERPASLQRVSCALGCSGVTPGAVLFCSAGCRLPACLPGVDASVHCPTCLLPAGAGL